MGVMGLSIIHCLATVLKPKKIEEICESRQKSN